MVSADPVSLTVLAYPQIQITTPVTEAVAGQTITVTVSISPAVYSLTPTVWVQRSLGRRTPLEVQKIAAGLFQAEAAMDSGRDLRIDAEVPAGEIQGARFETVRSETAIVQRTGEGELTSRNNLAKIGIGLVLGILVASLFFRFALPWLRRPERVLMPDLLRGNTDGWKRLDHLTVEKNWREIEALGKHVSRILEL